MMSFLIVGAHLYFSRRSGSPTGSVGVKLSVERRVEVVRKHLGGETSRTPKFSNDRTAVRCAEVHDLLAPEIECRKRSRRRRRGSWLRGLAEASLPAAAVQVVETTDRAAVGALISMPEYVDVIVPRGGGA